MRSLVIVSIIGVLVSACATARQPAYQLNEIAVLNLSRSLVQDVTIRVVSGERSFSCGNIAPRGVCSNRFAAREYQRNPIQIAWVFGNSANQTREFVLEVPPGLDPAMPLRGVLEITPQGAVRAYLEQGRP